MSTKTIFFLTLLITLFSFIAKATAVTGTIHLPDSTFKAELVLPNNIANLQKKLIYLDENKEEKTILPKPDTYFEFYIGENLIRMYAVRNNIKHSINQKYIFLRLLVKAQTKLFKFYRISTKLTSFPQTTQSIERVSLGSNAITSSFSTQVKSFFYFLEPNGGVHKVKQLHKRLSDLFGDCPGLTNKQKHRILDDTTLQFMEKFYHSNCAN